MQTVNLDLSVKNVVPLLHAKQGEVGRKFKAILTDNGSPYTPPSGAVVSVWFSGASGAGNYTDIGAKSAISISGNEITVEMITQMLARPGNGKLCLVINALDGTQLGTWNIPYTCEAQPGADSPVAKEYYTAFSEAVRQLQGESVGKRTEENGEIFNDYENNTAPARYSSARNRKTEAKGEFSDVSGYESSTSEEGVVGHAEGWRCHVNAPAGHAEGYDCVVDASYGHAQNHHTHVKEGATGASAGGRGTIAASPYQNVRGKYNVEDDDGEFAEIVGGGEGENHRKNIHTLSWKGDVWNAGATLVSEIILIGTDSKVDVDEKLKEVFEKLPNSSRKHLQLIINDSTNSNGLEGGNWFVTMYKPSDDYGTLEAVKYGFTNTLVKRRSIIGGIWKDWEGVTRDNETGAYYRMVDGEKEWINPPLSPSRGEFRTAERYGIYPLYAQMITVGGLPTNGTVSLNVGIPPESIIRMEGWAYGPSSDGHKYKYPMPMIASGKVDAYYLMQDTGKLLIPCPGSMAGWEARFTFWYIKH